MPKLSSLRSSIATFPPSSSCGGPAVTSSLGISSSLSSWIVMWKTSWTSSLVSSYWAYWREDWPMWMMVRLFTFSCPFVSTSKVAWHFILEGIELRTLSFSTRPSSFSFFGVVFLFLEGFLVSSSLSKVDRLGGELAVLLCFLGFDNFLKTEFWGVVVLSRLKTEVQSCPPMRSSAKTLDFERFSQSKTDVRGAGLGSS